MGHVRLETTALYTRVAALPQLKLTSPLDLLEQPKPAAPTTTPPLASRLLEPSSPPRKPCLHLRFEVRLVDAGSETTKRTAEAKIHITNTDQPLCLEGLRLQEVRPGWVMLELPPDEAWEETLRWLSPEQRERIDEPAFYRLLQDTLTRRFLALAT